MAYETVNMLSFFQIFGVQKGHSLVLTRHSGESSSAREEWEHEERDPNGRLVARYVSWEDRGASSNGYIKYDPSGEMIERRDDLPLSS